MIDDFKGDTDGKRGTGVGHMLRGDKVAALGLVLLLHAGAAVLMLGSEPTLVGVAVFILVWIMLNGLWLILLRRPVVAALISLEILIALTLLSRFKFEKL